MYVRSEASPSLFGFVIGSQDTFREQWDLSASRSILRLQSSDPRSLGDNADLKICAGVAICGGGKVLKVSPEAKVVGEISIPNARMITCPAFVDEDLFITSAEEEDPGKYPDSAKFGGSLFKVDVGVIGLPVHNFRRR